MKIINTQDYEAFAFVKENREIVSGKKYKTLKASVADLGYLISPIIVMKNDGKGNLSDLDHEDLYNHEEPKYIVIDGQHRLTVCRELEMEVPVIINDNAKREDIITANNTGNRWKLLDFVHTYTENEIPAFVFLNQMIISYGAVGFKTSAVIEAFAKIGQQGTSQVKDGTYEEDRSNGIKILESCLALKVILPDVYQQVKMIRALKNIFNKFPEWDIKILVDAMKNNPSTINNFELRAIPSKDAAMILSISDKNLKK